MTSTELLVFLLCYAGVGVLLAEGRDSTLTSCSRENSECTYRHHLVCPENTGIAVEGGEQRFDFSLERCLLAGWRCDHGCCMAFQNAGCTVAVTSEVLASLRQKCDGRQNCTADVTRIFVTCGRFNGNPFYSDSTIRYRCDQVQETTLTSTPITSQTAPPSSKNSEVTTSPRVSSSDVTTRKQIISSDVTTVDALLASSGNKGGVTGQRAKGDYSSPAPPTSNMAAVVGGAVAGAVTLLALSLVFLLCWRRRKGGTQTQTNSALAEDSTEHTYEMVDSDPAAASAPPSQPASSATKASPVTSPPHPSYVNAQAAMVVDDVSNAYVNLGEDCRARDVSQAYVNVGEGDGADDVSQDYEGLEAGWRERAGTPGLYQELRPATGAAGSRGAAT